MERIAQTMLNEGKKTFRYVGESGGDVFLDTSLAPGALVVSEGRALLADKDKVDAKEAQ